MFSLRNVFDVIAVIGFRAVFADCNICTLAHAPCYCWVGYDELIRCLSRPYLQERELNLKQRLLTTSLATISIMVGLMAVAGVLMFNLQFHIYSVNDEYRELQLLEQLDGRIVETQGELRADKPDFDHVNSALTIAIAELESFIEMQVGQKGQSQEHLRMENQGAGFLIQKIKTITSTIDSHDVISRDKIIAFQADLGEVHDHIQVLASSADDLVDGALIHSHRAISLASFLMISLFLLGLGLSLLFAYLQYKWCITPIQNLLDHVRKTVAIKPDLKKGHDDLIGNLNTGFTGLINQLDELYRTQDDRIRIKSRELVQSERLASVGYLAAGVAHEINNPLNSILGCSELLLRAAKKDEMHVSEENSQLLQIIRDEAFRCRQIVEKLLTLVRPSDAPREVVDLAQAASEVISLLDKLKQFRHCQFELDMPADTQLLVLARNSELKQVLLNLAINAAEATAGSQGQVRITGKTVNDNVELEVSDNGKGMTPEILEHVFDPFFTQKRGSEQVGVGLGLSIVFAIIQDHQGTIQALSDGPGKGSSFIISFPSQPGV